MAAPTAATGMTRFRSGTTTNLNAFSDSSCLTTGAAGRRARSRRAAAARRPRRPSGLAGPGGVGGLRGGGGRGAVGVDQASRLAANCCDELAAHLGQQRAAELGGLPVTFSDV